MTTENTSENEYRTTDRHIIVWSAEAANIEANRPISIDDVDNENASITDLVFDTEENEYLNVTRSQEISNTVIEISVQPLIVPELINWFAEHTDLPALHPHTAYNSDSWVVEEDNEIIAIALVNGIDLERITVLSHPDEERIREELMSNLRNEYDNLNTKITASL